MHSCTRVWFNKCFSSIHGVLRQLRNSWGDGLVLIGSHTTPFFGPLTECDVVELEPILVAPHAYVNWCLDFCKHHNVDVFVPGRMRDVIADHRSAFESLGTRLVLAGDGPTLRLLENKSAFLEAVPKSVSVHRFYRARNWAEFSSACNCLHEAELPICFKPTIGSYGLGFYVLDDDMTPLKRLLRSEGHRISSSELRTILGALDHFPELLVMEYLDGPEFSVDVLAHAGELKAMICRRKPLHRDNCSNGISRTCNVNEGSSQTLISEPKIEGMVRDLVSHFNLQGVLNVQFRSPRRSPDTPYVLEINGRMSGGLAYAGLSGINLLYLAIKASLLSPEETFPLIPKARLSIRVQERQEVFEFTD